MNNELNGKQLIIIGNGFDLQCGLKTKFQDYIEEIKSDNFNLTHQNMINDLLGQEYSKPWTGPCESRMSWWDIYFMKMEKIDENWNDFERQIELFINGSIIVDEDDEDSEFIRVGMLYKLLCIDLFDKITQESSKNKIELSYKFKKNEQDAIRLLAEFLYKKMEYHNYVNNIYSSWKTESKKSKYSSGVNEQIIERKKKEICDKAGRIKNIFDIIHYMNNLVLDLLYDELIIFELNLQIYITGKLTLRARLSNERGRLILSVNDPVKLNKEYNDKRDLLLEYLSGERTYNLLSFNYTYSTSIHNYKDYDEVPTRKNSVLCDNEVNIHGALDNHIIVGIDELSVKDNLDLYRFTKTYRTIMQADRVPENVLSENINCIKIYGHSLSEADYSYFQSIFDFYQIYSKDIKLIFYYSDYKQDARQEMVESVVSLLKDYGKTLNNKDHGNNLIHKLRLEGRLLIVKVPDNVLDNDN